MRDRVKCSECHWVGHKSELLLAQSPFDKDDHVTGCPRCKSIFGSDLHWICEIEGCTEEMSGGMPCRDGVYRSLCSKHYREFMNFSPKNIIDELNQL